MARVEAMSLCTAVTENISSTLKTKNISSDTSSSTFDKLVDQSNQGRDTKNVSSDPEQAISNTKLSNDYVDESKYQSIDDASLKSNNSTAVVEKQKDIESVETQLKQIVKDVLAIDEETMVKTMEQMGIVITDLLNPSVLQQFVLLVSGGGEATDFLTDEGLLASFNQLLTQLQQFADENHDAIVAMMEILETPVVLEESNFDAQFANSQVQDTFAGMLQEKSESLLENTQNGVQGDQNLADINSMQTKKSFDNVPAENTSSVNGQTTMKDSEMTDSAMVYVNELTEEDNESLNIQQVSVTTESGEEISVEAGAAEQEDTMFSEQEESAFAFSEQQETKNVAEHGNVMNDSIGGVNPAFSQTFDARVTSGVRMQQMIEIVNQVREQIRSTVSETTTTLEMQLNPESLGKVYMAVSSKAGVMTATFHVQSEEAKQALESQMYQLKENLEAKNLKVESVDVQISSFDFSHSNEAERQMQEANNKNAKKKYVFDAEAEENGEEITAEEVRNQAIRDAGSSVNYIA